MGLETGNYARFFSHYSSHNPERGERRKLRMTTYGYIDGKRVNEATITHMMGTKIVETQGACKWSRKCKSFDVLLGNGLCMSCWDNGGRPRGKQGRKTKTSPAIEEYLSRVSGEYYKQNGENK